MNAATAAFIAAQKAPPKNPKPKRHGGLPARRKRRAHRPRDPPVRAAYSVNDFCHVTGLSRATAFRMMRRGELKYAHIGRQRRIPVTEVNRLLATD